MYTINPACNIQKVANGYVVEIAQPPLPYYQPALPWKQMMKEQVEVIAETFKKIRKDDTLDNLGLTSQEEANHEEIQPAEPSAPQSNIYIFRTWSEVAGFLQVHFEK